MYLLIYFFLRDGRKREREREKGGKIQWRDSGTFIERKKQRRLTEIDEAEGGGGDKKDTYRERKPKAKK